MTVQKTFNDLGLSPMLIDAIKTKGFEEPTAIQAVTIPAMLAGDGNIIAQAQTGTGKTAAFGLPLIDMVTADSGTIQALVLVPTRELANQVADEINSLKGKKRLGIVPIYGGQSYELQLRQLKKGAHIVVGTPGRVIDHLERKTLVLNKIDFLVLDEADEMLNMGFIEDVEKIMKHTGNAKRTLLFSATMPERIKELARKYMPEFEQIIVKKEQMTTTLTEQVFYEVKATDKFEALCRLIDHEKDFYGLVFCRMKNDVDEVAQHLLDRGYDAEPIHGDISQIQRERTLDKFRKKRINVLVATDVAARGIDVSNLTHVVNFSLPQGPESYVHRIGRTGRAGNEGTAVTFIVPSEYSRLMFIQRITKSEIKKARVPSVHDIIKSKQNKICEDIKALIDKPVSIHYRELAERLLKDTAPETVVAAILKYGFKNDLNPSTYREIHDFGEKKPHYDRQGPSKKQGDYKNRNYGKERGYQGRQADGGHSHRKKESPKP
jgi:ATP-dependent RNA helicase DeaD